MTYSLLALLGELGLLRDLPCIISYQVGEHSNLLEDFLKVPCASPFDSMGYALYHP